MNDDKHPTSIAELKAMIEAEWPAIDHTRFAICPIDAETGRVRLQTIDGVLVDRFRPYVWAVPISMTCIGVVIAGQQVAYEPMMTEDQVARCLWFHYRQKTPPKDLVTGNTGVCFVWRAEPELGRKDGSYTGYMRYAAIYRNREGEIVPHAAPVRSA